MDENDVTGPMPGQTALFPNGPAEIIPHTKSPANVLEWTILELISEHRRGLTDSELARFIQDPLAAKLRARAGLVTRKLIYWKGETRTEGQMVWHATNRGRWMLEQVADA